MIDRKFLFTSIFFSAVLLNAEFVEPADIFHWTCKEGARSTGQMSFEFFNNSRVILSGQTNGSDASILLDSGFSGAAVDATRAQQLGLKITGTISAQSGGGQVNANVATGARIKIGCLEVVEPMVGVLDLQTVSRQLGHPIDAIIGQDVLQHLIIDLDFQRQKIAFISPEEFREPTSMTKVSLGENGPLKTIPISVEGGPLMPFDLDLGNALPIILFSSYPNRDALLTGRRSSQTLLIGLGGQVPAQITTLKSVSFGGIVFSGVPSVFAPAGGGSFNSRIAYGNIGMPFLCRFRVILDLGHNNLWLLPSTDAATRIFEKDRSGLRLTRSDNRLVVVFVAPGSPAEHAGWEVGEQIVAVNNTKIDPTYAASKLSHWQADPPNTVVHLTLANGDQRDLILADYY